MTFFFLDTDNIYPSLMSLAHYTHMLMQNAQLPPSLAPPRIQNPQKVSFPYFLLLSPHLLPLLCQGWCGLDAALSCSLGYHHFSCCYAGHNLSLWAATLYPPVRITLCTGLQQRKENWPCPMWALFSRWIPRPNCVMGYVEIAHLVTSIPQSPMRNLTTTILVAYNRSEFYMSCKADVALRFFHPLN